MPCLYKKNEKKKNGKKNAAAVADVAAAQHRLYHVSLLSHCGYLGDHFHTYLTATDSRPQIAGFKGLGLGGHELGVGVYRGQPEAVLVGEVVAGAPGPVALDEGRGAEVLQTAAGARQGLTPTSWAGRCVLGKRS